jgi:hypothetical protein
MSISYIHIFVYSMNHDMRNWIYSNIRIYQKSYIQISVYSNIRIVGGPEVPGARAQFRGYFFTETTFMACYLALGASCLVVEPGAWELVVKPGAKTQFHGPRIKVLYFEVHQCIMMT